MRGVRETRAAGTISAGKTAPRERTRERTQRKTTSEPPYKVLLHNDDFTPMEHVVAALRKVIPRMSTPRAVSIMLEAHTKGKAVAAKAHKEVAELYAEGLNNEGLIASIEPD